MNALPSVFLIKKATVAAFCADVNSFKNIHQIFLSKQMSGVKRSKSSIESAIWKAKFGYGRIFYTLTIYKNKECATKNFVYEIFGVNVVLSTGIWKINFQIINLIIFKKTFPYNANEIHNKEERSPDLLKKNRRELVFPRR